MKRNTKERGNWRADTICAVCKEPVNDEFPVRSNTWAYGFAGVRMMLCSVACRDKFDERSRT